HRFEDRVRNSLLVLVGRGLARVEKTMGAPVKIEQLPLGKEPAKMDLLRDAEFFRQFFEVRLQRPFSRDDQLGIGKLLLENRERAERSRNPFFGNEPTGLHEPPAAVRRRVAADEGELVK